MAAYQLLFSFTVEHDFFADGRCQQLAIEPSAATHHAMQRAGLLVRPLANGVAVWIAADRVDQLRGQVADANDALALVFAVRSNDPHFGDYTVPVLAPDTVFFLDSRAASVDAAGRQMLHATPFVDQHCVQASDHADVAAAVAGSGWLRQPSVLVRIALTNALTGLCADGLDPALRHFGARFDAGHSHWKYFLLGALSDRSVQITDLDAAVAFRRVDSVDFPGRRQAAVFVSDRAIPLRDMPSQRFQLTESASFGDKVLIKRMPNARVASRQKDVVDGHAVLVSEIFINP